MTTLCGPSWNLILPIRVRLDDALQQKGLGRVTWRGASGRNIHCCSLQWPGPFCSSTIPAVFNNNIVSRPHNVVKCNSGKLNQAASSYSPWIGLLEPPGLAGTLALLACARSSWIVFCFAPGLFLTLPLTPRKVGFASVLHSYVVSLVPGLDDRRVAMDITTTTTTTPPLPPPIPRQHHHHHHHQYHDHTTTITAPFPATIVTRYYYCSYYCSMLLPSPLRFYATIVK